MRILCLALLPFWWPTLLLAQLQIDFLDDLPAAVRGDYTVVEELMSRGDWESARPLVQSMQAAVLAADGAMLLVGLELAVKRVRLLDAMDRDDEALA